MEQSRVAAVAVATAAIVCLISTVLPWFQLAGNVTLLQAAPGNGYADALIAAPIVALVFAGIRATGRRATWLTWGMIIALGLGFTIATAGLLTNQMVTIQLGLLSISVGSLPVQVEVGAWAYLTASLLGAISATADFPGVGGWLGRWVARQFTTRVIVLIPVAIAINIVLGYTVQTVLKLPIYLDSIGTILVGVLAGPLAGALTGALSNLIWQYAPVIGGGTIGPFAITAAVIGFLAGIWGYLGVFRSRPASGPMLLIGAAVAAALAILVAYPILNNPAYTDPNVGGYPSWVYTAAIAIAVVVAIVVAVFIYLRRDLAGLWVAIAGVITGVVAAFVSAPIAAIVFGGVTGSGTDLLVAALRQGGSDVYQASLGQGLFSDPVDKLITSFVVFMILASLSPRFLARFPLGDRLTRPSGPTSPMDKQ